MTLQEIEALAGHRALSPWVIKLVGDAVAAEREACAKVCDELQDVPATEPRHCAEDIRARGQA